jgi:hypothetical protein
MLTAGELEFNVLVGNGLAAGFLSMLFSALGLLLDGMVI